MVSYIKRTLGKIQFTNNIDSMIFKTSLIGVFLIVLVQILLCNNTVKSIIGISNNNIIAMELSDINNPSGWVEINLYNSINDHLLIYKNGQVYRDWSIKDDIIKIVVYDGDIIELKVSNNEDNSSVIIYDISKNITNPKKGDRLKNNGNIQYLFKIILDKSKGIMGQIKSVELYKVLTYNIK